jgi:hypothetical protein
MSPPRIIRNYTFLDVKDAKNAGGGSLEILAALASLLAYCPKVRITRVAGNSRRQGGSALEDSLDPPYGNSRPGRTFATSGSVAAVRAMVLVGSTAMVVRGGQGGASTRSLPTGAGGSPGAIPV